MTASSLSASAFGSSALSFSATPRISRQPAHRNQEEGFAQTFHKELSHESEVPLDSTASRANTRNSLQQRTPDANQSQRDEVSREANGRGTQRLASESKQPGKSALGTAEKRSSDVPDNAKRKAVAEEPPPSQNPNTDPSPAWARKAAGKPQTNDEPLESSDTTQLSPLVTGALAIVVPADANAASDSTSNVPPAKPTESKDDSPDSVASASARNSPAPLGDLAIALRVTPNARADVSHSDGQQSPAEEASGPKLGQQPAAGAGAADLNVKQSHEPEQLMGAIAVPAQPGHTVNHSSAAAPPQESAPPTPPDAESELTRAHAEPVRGARVQISGGNNQRIDIHLQERAGSLSVTVRSGDASVARTLQEHAPELSSRLSMERYRSDLWTPATAKPSQDQNTNSGAPFGHGRGPGYQQQPNQNQNQNGKQKQQPGWIEEFESHPAAFTKRIEYTWQ